MARLKVGVLISGRGSNLRALIDSCARPNHAALIGLVISNVTAARGLEIAATNNVPIEIIDHKLYPDRPAFDAALDASLREHGIELVCMAGFMRLLTDGFVEAWRDRLINIHPSLLPAFKGRHPQRQALAAGARISGCTVHYVRPQVDAGPIVAQSAVPVLEGDSEESLSARILAAEHLLYPLAVQLIAAGEITLAGERAVLSPTAQRNLATVSGLRF
ncbi:MAG: phosphoribosylglycinamide formyltransferase [Alphaproteobacteria bacterium]|jgi:phosphoribosylglycinamide formyltransferase-1|nr:phosphoribosylglycinamide formyltransferase [Alphaproteobacteria bacterium]